MGIKPGPKRIAVSTGKPDRRQRDNKDTPFLLNPCCSKVKSLLKATASLTLWRLLFLYKKRNTNEYIVYTFLIF